MRQTLRMAFGFLALLSSAVCTFGDNVIEHGAVVTKPAGRWEEGFLTGNGNMGVIMQGDPYAEKLVINGKLYLPLGSKEIMPDLSGFRDEFKKAGLAAGKDGPAVVHRLMVEKSGMKLVNTDPFHPAFLLRLGMKGQPGAVKNYRMTEDFATGELNVRWSDEQGDWCRKVFVSRQDDVVVLSIEGPKGKVDCELAMEVKHALVKSDLVVEDGWIGAHNTYLKGKGGYDNLIRVVPAGGRVSRRDDGLSVSGADSILVIMQVKQWKAPLSKEESEGWAFSPDNPEFKGAYPANRLAELKAKLSGLRPDYAGLFVPHARAHGALYDRIVLDLGGGADRGLTSEELLARAVATNGTMSSALAERLYNACRYLIICSSGDTPPNLQGMWTGTWSPAWSGDYTLDSNLQLEIQSMMSCNMPELMESYFNLVDSWIPDWRLNAKKIFGFRGVVSNARASNTCLLLHWGGWPGDQASIGIAGWLLHFYYDYYQFTGDRKFLAQRFVPLAKEIALFYEDFLAGTEGADGKYRFYMGYSPEHGLNANTTYDIAIARNVLVTLTSACRELGLEQDNISKWEAMLAKMPPYLVNVGGELQEWSWLGVAENYNMRHHSHFLPLYQFCEFDREATPGLWKAAELAFDQKVNNWLHREKGSDSNHITHGMMNQGQCAARLGRSDVIYEVLARMVTRKYVYPGFMISYWPGLKGYGFDPVGTLPDVLNNSLVFAWKGTLDLLPALPKEWPKGRIKGVAARGQLKIDELAWDLAAGKVSLKVTSGCDQKVTIRLPAGFDVKEFKCDGGASVLEAKPGEKFCRLDLKAGKTAIVDVGLALSAGSAPTVTAVSPPKPYGPVPNERQLRWHEDEVIGMVNFSTITYYGKEWGYGDEDPAKFNPAEFDARQIVRAAKSAGMKLLVLDAKHHGGFCLWPSSLNESYTVKNSPWRNGKGDMIRELADACRAEGLKVGIYLSPWDRNHKDYGLPAYVTYYHEQLRELLTNYGEIHEVWFDGANGGDGWYGGAKCARKITADYYQWDKVMKLVRELQPMAVCFGREDIRWVGNESGVAGDACWATVTRAGGKWCPAESDFPQRTGWFWQPGDHTKTPGDLVNRYFASVGHNTVMDLGIAPDRRGLICEEDTAALREFGDRTRAIFATNLAASAQITAGNTRPGFPAGNLIDGNVATYWAADDDVLTPAVIIDFGKPVTFSVVSMREYIQLGHRVDDWALDKWEDGTWKELYAGTCIGAHRLWRGEAVTSNKIRLRITKAAACPAIAEMGVYLEPESSRLEACTVQPHRIETGILKTGWKIVSASRDGGSASNAIDGKPGTIWCTRTGAGNQPPQEIVVDMGTSQEIAGFLYLPRQDLSTAGNISQYAFHVSEEGTTWGDPAAEGEFGNIRANPVQQKVKFARPVKGRYFRLTALRSADGDSVAVAEIGVTAK